LFTLASVIAGSALARRANTPEPLFESTRVAG
jgi:hypothetical protein